MLRNYVMNRLIESDVLDTLHQLTVSAKEYLELEDKQTCLVEMNKIQESIEGLQEVITILNLLETIENSKENSGQNEGEQSIGYQLYLTKVYN